MTIFDKFYDDTQIFEGKIPEKLTIQNMKDYESVRGKEWIAGYMKAMEIFAVDLADILQPRDDNPGGVIQSPHMVRTNLKKYWVHNKNLYLALSSQIDAAENPKIKPQTK